MPASSPWLHAASPSLAVAILTGCTAQSSDEPAVVGPAANIEAPPVAGPIPPPPIRIRAKPPPSNPTRILDQAAADRLLGNSGVTLQWISWDYRGDMRARYRNGRLSLFGEQAARDGPLRGMSISGGVVEIGADYFIFSGNITIENTPDKGRYCSDSRVDWRFEVTQGRKYWRLREFEWCDGLTDYVDIYF